MIMRSLNISGLSVRTVIMSQEPAAMTGSECPIYIIHVKSFGGDRRSGLLYFREKISCGAL